MIILKLRAGLGNQLFQYAYARARALRSNTTLTVDTSWFSNIASGDTKRDFLLNVYNIPKPPDVYIDTLQENTFLKLFRKIWAKINRDIFKYSDYKYYPSLARPVSRDIVIEGFWNTEKYFKDYTQILKNELTLITPLGDNTEQLKQHILEIKNTRTLILLHVRRGDYISNFITQAHHGFSGVEYYSKAIELLKEKIRDSGDVNNLYFILASDDTEWLRQNIIPLLETFGFNEDSFQILSNQSKIKDYEELHLMSLCHHFIIANSTFSWWAAWLSDSAEKAGQEKIVIGPKQWIVDPTVDTRDVMPEDWIRI